MSVKLKEGIPERPSSDASDRSYSHGRFVRLLPRLFVINTTAASGPGGSSSWNFRPRCNTLAWSEYRSWISITIRICVVEAYN